MANKKARIDEPKKVGKRKRVLDDDDEAAADPSSLSPLDEAGQESGAAAAPARERRKRRVWSQEEIDELMEGYNKFGAQWAHILAVSPHMQATGRSGNDIKDKYRNLKKKMEMETE